MLVCSVLNCEDRTASRYELPKNAFIRREWVKAMRNPEMLQKNLGSYKVCRNHFEPICFNANGRLIKNAVPTLNLPGLDSDESSTCFRNPKTSGKILILPEKICAALNDTRVSTLGLEGDNFKVTLPTKTFTGPCKRVNVSLFGSDAIGESEKRNEWNNAISKAFNIDFEINKGTRICEDHFALAAYSSTLKTRLLRGAVPSILQKSTSNFYIENMINKYCCIAGCNSDNVQRHRFPHPKKEAEWFITWINVIGCQKLRYMDPMRVYYTKRICGAHFEDKCNSPDSNGLLWDSVPTLRLPAGVLPKEISSGQLVPLLFTKIEERIDEVVIDDNTVPEEALLLRKFTDITTLCSDELSQRTDPNPPHEQLHLLCRTCLAETNLQEISKLTYKGASLAETLTACTTVQVKKDEFSQYICMKCIENLTRTLKFIETCKESYDIFKKIKGKRKLEDINLSMLDHNYTKQPIQENNATLVASQENDSYKDDIVELDDSPISTVSQLQENEITVESFCRIRKQFACNSCGLGSLSRYKLVKHLLQHTTEEPKVMAQLEELNNVCNVCDETFSSSDDLDIHKCEHTLCNMCGKQFLNIRRLKMHMRIHKKDHRCKICNENFISRLHLNQHSIAHLGTKRFSCEFCAKSFSSQHNLKYHTMTHTGERPHICEICGRGFIVLCNFRKHRQLHEQLPDKNTSTTCEHCGQHFLRTKNYKAHRCKNSNPSTNLVPEEKKEKNYICEICASTFSTSRGLRDHITIHKPKTIICNICGKAFARKSDLKKHQLTHTGEKRHECSTCGKLFARLTGLNKHVLIHYGIKLFKCHICQKSFTQTAHLKRHLQSHTGI